MAKSESTKIEFGYFHDYESEQFAFYRIPKVLFTDEYFRNLSSDAKVLYGLMLDRMAYLSDISGLMKRVRFILFLLLNRLFSI